MPLGEEANREYQREWMRRRRAAWFEGKSCGNCGSTERLEANHINPTEKVYNPGRIWGMSDSNPRKIAELAKLEALCHECHVNLSRTEIAHGTRSGHNYRGCRCSACRAWSAAKSRRDRARRKAQ